MGLPHTLKVSTRGWKKSQPKRSYVPIHFVFSVCPGPQRIVITETYIGTIQQGRYIRGPTGCRHRWCIPALAAYWTKTPANSTDDSRNIQAAALTSARLPGSESKISLSTVHQTNFMLSAANGPCLILHHPGNHSVALSFQLHPISSPRSCHSDQLGCLETTEEWNQVPPWDILTQTFRCVLRGPYLHATSATALTNWLNFASEANAHDGTPVGLIETIYDRSSFQKLAARVTAPRDRWRGDGMPHS